MSAPAGGRSEREWLESHGIRPRKRLGQNFLLDRRIPQLAVERASFPPSSNIIEIGPGGGALTSALLEAGHQVHAIETDADLVTLLRERFSGDPRFDVLHGDALRVDWDPSFDEAGKLWIAGNLPYSITTPLLVRALDRHDRFAGMVVMVQREYGERLLAPHGNKTYGSITVWTRVHAEGRSLLKVGRSSFWPRPGVESVVIELKFRDAPQFGGDRRLLQRVIRAAFAERRKKIRNTLASGLQMEKPKLEALLKSIDVDPEARAEHLEWTRFVQITEAMVKHFGERDDPPGS